MSASAATVEAATAAMRNTAIGDAARAAHTANQARMAAQAARGRCTALLSGNANCQSPVFQAGLCFDHHRSEHLKAHPDPRRKPVARATPNKATVIELVGSVGKQPAFARMVGYSLECLKKLAVDEVAVEEILDQNAIPALDAALDLHPNNEQLHLQYMECLETFARNGHLANKVGAQMKGNFNKLGNSLRQHSDVNTHIATARAMAALADDVGNMDAMADQGLLDALADAVKRNPDNADLLAAAAKVFSKFAGAKQEYADFITRSGAVEHIVQGMQKQPDHHDLARNGAELLAILANSGRDNCAHLKNMGAVDALVAALEAHPYDRFIEAHATRALQLLTGEGDMVAALAVCSGDMALDLAAAKALSKVASLLLVADNVDTMFRVKGVEWLLAVLTSALGMHDKNGERILSSGCRALMRSATDANRIYELIRHGAVPLLVNILNTRVDPDVLAAALGALARLVDANANNAAYIVKHGGVNAALRAFASNPDSSAILRPALDLLMALACFEGLHSALAQAGTIEALVDMLRRNMHDVGVVRDCIAALGRLATKQEHVERMARAGLPPLLVDALSRHGDDEAAVLGALMALEIAAMLPSNIADLLRLGAVEAIGKAMGRWPGNKEIQAAGQRALALLLKQQQDELERARLEALARQKREEDERRRREEEERRRFEKEMADALARLKAQDEEDERKRRALEAAKKKQKELDDSAIKLKAMREKEAAAARPPLEPVWTSGHTGPPEMPPPVQRMKSARDIFENDEESKPVFELDPRIKQFLQTGQMLVKHSKTALPKQLHVYMNHDCTHVIWNKPMTEVVAKHTMSLPSLISVERGHATPQLRRVRFGHALAGPEEVCFSLFGVATDTSGRSNGERTVDLQCKTRAEREKWVEALEHLIQFVRTKKLYGQHTVHMDNHDKIQKQLQKEKEAPGASAAAAGASAAR